MSYAVRDLLVGCCVGKRILTETSLRIYHVNRTLLTKKYSHTKVECECVCVRTVCTSVTNEKVMSEAAAQCCVNEVRELHKQQILCC